MLRSLIVIGIIFFLRSITYFEYSGLLPNYVSLKPLDTIRIISRSENFVSSTTTGLRFNISSPCFPNLYAFSILTFNWYLHFLFLYCFCKNLKLDQHNFDFFYWYRFYVQFSSGAILGFSSIAKNCNFCCRVFVSMPVNLLSTSLLKA